MTHGSYRGKQKVLFESQLFLEFFSRIGKGIDATDIRFDIENRCLIERIDPFHVKKTAFPFHQSNDGHANRTGPVRRTCRKNSPGLPGSGRSHFCIPSLTSIENKQNNNIFTTLNSIQTVFECFINCFG